MLESKVLNNSDLKLKLPFGMVIAGPSNSGKTTFLLKLLRDYKELIEPVPESIVYCYGEYHSQIPLLQKSGIAVHKGMPNDEILDGVQKPSLIILDDLLYSLDETFLSNIFVKKIHHMRIGVILIVQNLFDKRIKVRKDNKS